MENIGANSANAPLSGTPVMHSFHRVRADSNASGLNTSKVSYTSMGTSFSDRMLRMKPMDQKKDQNQSGRSSDSSRSSTDDEYLAHKKLSLFDLIMFGIGNTIGAGIFALTGIAA